jgi:hypothetical protein
MKSAAQLEHRASSSRSKHEGESSFALCDRLSRTRDNSQRQLPTDQDYAVPTREYQTDQSSLKTAPTAARSILEKQRKQRQQQKKISPFTAVDTVTPYQGNALIQLQSRCSGVVVNRIGNVKRRRLREHPLTPACRQCTTLELQRGRLRSNCVRLMHWRR